MKVVYVDGICEPISPGGVAIWSYIIKDFELHTEVRHNGLAVPEFSIGGSLYVAKYRGIFEALQQIFHGGKDTHVVIRTDDEAIMKIMTGKWVQKSQHLDSLIESIKQLSSLFEGVSYQLVTPSQNKQARELTRLQYKAIVREWELHGKRVVIKKEKGAFGKRTASLEDVEEDETSEV